MSNVTLTIGGREYKVACADGEESHVKHLGNMIDEKLSDMDGAAAQSETRLLLFASLLLADEIHELRQSASAAPPQELPLARQQSDAPSAAPLLEQFADQLENLAMKLESQAGTS